MPTILMMSAILVVELINIKRLRATLKRLEKRHLRVVR